MPVSSGFWPDDIRPDVQTPLAILRARAIELNDLTKGTLIGSVATTTDKASKQTYHSLDVNVPVLRGLRQRLFTVRHQIDMVYPVYIHQGIFESFSDQKPISLELAKAFDGLVQGKSNEYAATTDTELLELLKRALHSDNVKSKLVSLIAMANQAEGQSEADSVETPVAELEGEETDTEERALDES